MSTPVSFQLGILPERKLDRRALAASYGLLVLLIIVMINIGWIWPDSMNISRQYHVTELIPMPSLQPEPLENKAATARGAGQAPASRSGFRGSQVDRAA